MPSQVMLKDAQRRDLCARIVDVDEFHLAREVLPDCDVRVGKEKDGYCVGVYSKGDGREDTLAKVSATGKLINLETSACGPRGGGRLKNDCELPIDPFLIAMFKANERHVKPLKEKQSPLLIEAKGFLGAALWHMVDHHRTPDFLKTCESVHRFIETSLKRLLIKRKFKTARFSGFKQDDVNSFCTLVEIPHGYKIAKALRALRTRSGGQLEFSPKRLLSRQALGSYQQLDGLANPSITIGKNELVSLLYFKSGYSYVFFHEFEHGETTGRLFRKKEIPLFCGHHKSNGVGHYQAYMELDELPAFAASLKRAALHLRNHGLLKPLSLREIILSARALWTVSDIARKATAEALNSFEKTPPTDNLDGCDLELRPWPKSRMLLATLKYSATSQIALVLGANALQAGRMIHEEKSPRSPELTRYIHDSIRRRLQSINHASEEIAAGAAKLNTIIRSARFTLLFSRRTQRDVAQEALKLCSLVRKLNAPQTEIPLDTDKLSATFSQ